MAPSPTSSPSRRRFLQTAAAGCAGAILPSCGWRLGNVQSNPKQMAPSDQLSVYTWEAYVDKDLLKDFQTEAKIKVTSEVFDSNETMLATFEAGKGSTYSVIYPSEITVQQMVQKDYLTELDVSRLAGLENLLPRFREPHRNGGKRYSVPVSWGVTGLIYNPEKLSEPPTDWDYLWKHKDKLTRRMTLLSDVREVMGAVLKSLGHSYNSENPQELKAASEKLLKLKPAIASFTTDAWKDQLLAGDLWIAMGYSSDAAEALKQNPKLKFLIPKSGTSLWSDTMVIPKSAPNPDAAYDWINYMLRPEVAASMTQRLSFATTNEDAIAQLPQEWQANQTLFPPDRLLSRCETLAPVERGTAELFEKYWTQVSNS
jgi:spermidine/putrescine transport system substrate-binding protein